MTAAAAERVLDLAERALGHLRGGDSQATVVRERSLFSRFARSRPTQATAVDDTTVMLLRIHDGHPGAASTNDHSDDGLRLAARRADAAARAAAVAAGPGDHPGLPEHQPARPHDGFDLATAALDPAAAGAALRAAFDACADQGLEAFGLWTAGHVETAIASTTGVRAHDALTDAYFKVIARDDTGRTGWGVGASTAARDIDPGAIARRAAAKVPQTEPVALPPGDYPVVLEPDAVGELLQFLGWLGFNGLAHAEGRGALTNRLGSRVAAPAVNLSDSPRFVRTLPRAYDFEGVPKAPIPLIQDGVAHAVVHDRRSAARAGGGAGSTGHALAPGGSPHGPVPTNLVLIGGGAADEHELAAPIERGLYVTRFWYVNPVHERSALLTGTTRDGTFLIEDGQITRPAKDVRFTDSILRVLEGTQALTAQQRLVSEADFYGRRFAFGVVCPALRAAALRVTA